MVGKVIAQYRVIAKLGEGGMGVVYKAEDTKLRRTVALKFLREGSAPDRVATERFLREARTASALNHPNICTVYEIGEIDGRTFIAMEYIEGRALTALIPAAGLSTEQLVRYGKQIAEALAHSHERGVVHRDLKSSNVMVTPEGRIKVLDFGLAKRLAQPAAGEDATQTQRASVSQTGLIVGTLSYMSPEALRGEPADACSDVWSFGVLLYEMATGVLPFQGKSLFDLTAAVLREPIPELPTRIGAGLRALLGRCLARERAQRYQRGGEVLAAIESIESASQPMPAVPSRWVSRRNWLSISAGATILTALGAAGILWLREPRTYGPVPSKVPEANEYLQRAVLFITTQNDVQRARQLLEKSLELDPQFAHARAWYGFTYLLLIDSGLSNDTTLVYKAEEELRRSLQLDPNSARAHAALAFVYLYQGRKELARQEAGKATEMDPHEREGFMMLAFYHELNGDTQLAQALWKKQLQIDPLFYPARWNLGATLEEMGDGEGGIREQEKVLEQDPKNVPALLLLAHANMSKGDLTRARRALEDARALEPRNYKTRIAWALQLAMEGQRRTALTEMDPDLLKYGEVLFMPPLVAEFYAVLGDKAKALDWLERAVRGGDDRAEWFQRDPLLANLREEPRFRQVLDSIRYRRQQGAR